LERDAILEQSSGPGEFNRGMGDGGVIDGARKAVAALYQKTNFAAQAMISRLGIRADIASYKRVEQAMAAE
jgi:hypothetical protein